MKFVISKRYINDNQYHGGKVPKSAIKGIVVHHTAGNTPGDLQVLRGNTNIKVSVKYLVPDPADGNYYTKDGKFIIYQLLPNEVVGWSIGKSTGKYASYTNQNTMSIEISNRGNGKDVFEKVQMEAVKWLIAYEEHRLKKELKVLAHYDTSPGRKTDPHKSFDMDEIKDFAEWHKHNAPKPPNKPAKRYATVEPARLNVRARASVMSRVVGVAKKGDKLHFIAKGERWTRVEWKDGFAYVATKFLRF